MKYWSHLLYFLGINFFLPFHLRASVIVCDNQCLGSFLLFFLVFEVFLLLMLYTKFRNCSINSCCHQSFRIEVVSEQVRRREKSSKLLAGLKSKKDREIAQPQCQDRNLELLNIIRTQMEASHSLFFFDSSELGGMWSIFVADCRIVFSLAFMFCKIVHLIVCCYAVNLRQF